MTIITMLQTRKGTDDGFIVRQFYKGKTYEVSYSNAVMMIGRGWAVEDLYASLKKRIASNNNKSKSIRDFLNQSEADIILNSDLPENQKIELLQLIKIKGE